MEGNIPLYQYIDDRDNKIYDLIQGMNDVHEAFAPDGYKLTRIWNKPEMGVDTSWDANSSQDFINKTGKKSGTLNDLWEKSAELSEKREKQLGKDPIKEKMHEDYKKLRKKDHPDVRKQKLKESLNNNPKSPFTIDI